MTSEPLLRRARVLNRLAGFLLVVLLIVAPAAHAQSYISPFIGSNIGGDFGCQPATSCEDTASNVGVACGRGGAVGFEEEFLYAKNFFGQSTTQTANLLTLMSNLVAGPRIGYVRPYGLVGFGFMKARTQLTASALTSNDTTMSWDVGGGLEAGLY